MKQVSNSAVSVKRYSPLSTGNPIFTDCLGDATRATEDIEKSLQKLIPDGLIGRFGLSTESSRPFELMHSWGFASRKGMFAVTKEGIVETKI